MITKNKKYTEPGIRPPHKLKGKHIVSVHLNEALEEGRHNYSDIKQIMACLDGGEG